jgi:hypothetical protein
MPPAFINYPAPRGHIITSTLLNASFIYKLSCTPWTYLYIHTKNFPWDEIYSTGYKAVKIMISLNIKLDTDNV